jgi:hypothetical protein
MGCPKIPAIGYIPIIMQNLQNKEFKANSLKII